MHFAAKAALVGGGGKSKLKKRKTLLRATRRKGIKKAVMEWEIIFIPFILPVPDIHLR